MLEQGALRPGTAEGLEAATEAEQAHYHRAVPTHLTWRPSPPWSFTLTSFVSSAAAI